MGLEVRRLKRFLRPTSTEEVSSALSLVAVGTGRGSLDGFAVSQSGKASALARQIASNLMRQATLKLAFVGTVAAVGLLTVAGYSARLLTSPASPTASATAADIFQLPADNRLATYPIAPGWPVALPGSICGTPVIADLEQPGQHCIVVASMADRENVDVALVHPRPDPRPLIYALHADGSPVDGFPIALDVDLPRRGKIFWASHPSIVPADSGGNEGILVVSPAGRIDWIHDHQMQQIGEHAGPGATVPVLARSDDVLSQLLVSVGQSKALIWPAPKIAAFAGSGVGRLYGSQWFGEVAASDSPQRVVALSHLGAMLPGWPRPTLESFAVAPAFGNLDDDPLMEICPLE